MQPNKIVWYAIKVSILLVSDIKFIRKNQGKHWKSLYGSKLDR